MATPRKRYPKVKKAKAGNPDDKAVKILDWVKEQVKGGPVLWTDRLAVVDPESGSTVTRDVRKLRELSLGIISCNDAREWYRVCRHHCPVGTILEDFNEQKWVNVYEDFKALVHTELTKSMLTEENATKAKLLLDVLERRDREHWLKEQPSRKVEVTAPTDKEGAKEFKVAFVGI